MFGLTLACAFAADTPTTNAKTLNPPIKARFIRAPPFGQENATLFIGSINNNKIKECLDADFQRDSGKIFINAASFVPGKEPSRGRFRRARFRSRGCERRSSISDALSPGCGLPAPWAGPLPARVRIAEAAVARNHLPHAHLEGWDGAILGPLRRYPSVRTKASRRLGLQAG